MHDSCICIFVQAADDEHGERQGTSRGYLPGFRQWASSVGELPT